MIDSTGLALILGGIALYAYDASLLLFRDEVVFAHARGRWRATLGSGFVLGGRYLLAPAFLRPGLPMFRAGWSDRGHRGAPLRVVLRALAPLQWASRLLALLLFVALPVALVLHARPAWMLALVVAVYGTAIACVAWAWRCREVFGLDRRSLAALAFDVVACPPFAVNVVQKLTLRLHLPNAPEDFARRVLAPADANALLRAAHARAHPDIATESVP